MGAGNAFGTSNTNSGGVDFAIGCPPRNFFRCTYAGTAIKSATIVKTHLPEQLMPYLKAVKWKGKDSPFEKYYPA
jgi:hypothetical protein